MQRVRRRRPTRTTRARFVTMVARTPARARRRAVNERDDATTLASETFARAIAPPVDARTLVRENVEMSNSELSEPPQVAAAAERESARERRRKGDGIANGRRANVPGWWKKVDPTPIEAHGVDLSIPRGPYPSAKDATAALKRLAIAERRGIKTCTRRHSGKRSVLMCKAVEALRVTGKRDVVPGVDCAYTAIIEKNDRVRYGATGSFWITKYVPHTYHLCRAVPSYPVKSIARDPRVRAIVKAGGEKVKGRAIVSAVLENFGIAIPARSATIVKRTVLSEAEETYNETCATDAARDRARDRCAMPKRARACDDVKHSCARVRENASDVEIDLNAIQAFVDGLSDEDLSALANGPRAFDAAMHDVQSEGARANALLAIDAINFCFWPDHGEVESGERGLEYEDVAGGVRTVASEDANAVAAATLAAMEVGDLRTMLNWPRALPQEEERVRLLREVGEGLLEHFDGSARKLIEAAKGSAAKLVDLVLMYFPGFRDAAVYKGRQVHFYKRAQIFVGDVWGAFQGEGLGRFDDIESTLTMFADYRVPVVLRECGILKYSERLAQKVRTKQIIPANSEEEIEIRACTIVAVEEIKRLLVEKRKLVVSSVVIDWMLWEIGEKKRYTSHEPHHRTLTIFY